MMDPVKEAAVWFCRDSMDLGKWEVWSWMLRP